MRLTLYNVLSGEASLSLSSAGGHKPSGLERRRDERKRRKGEKKKRTRLRSVFWAVFDRLMQSRLQAGQQIAVRYAPEC